MKYPAYPSYKPSGVESFGEVPQGWEVKRLKDFIHRLESGVSVNSEASPAEEGSPGVLKTSCVYGDCFRSTESKRILDDDFDRAMCPVKGNSLIISRMNTPDLVGSCGYVTTDEPNLFLPDRLWQAVFARHVAAHPKFFWFLIVSSGIKSMMSSLATGTSDSMKNLAQKDFLGLTFGAPPLPEQRAIADFLDAKTSRLDTLVAKKRTLIGRLKEKRTALISRTVTRGFDPHAKLKPSGVEWLGEVPEHWEVVQLGRKIMLQRGVDITKDEQNDGDVPVVSSGGVSSFHDTPVAVGPGVVVGRKGTAGAVYYVESDFWPHDTTLWVKEFRGNHPRYVFHKLCAMDLASFDTGSANPTVNRNLVHPVIVPWPPAEEQKTIADYLDRETAKIDRMVAKVEAAVERLQEYRAALITAAVTGKIDVRGCEPGAEASTLGAPKARVRV